MQEIYDIYSEYPWASELTATRMAEATSNAPQTRARIAGLFASSTSSGAYKSLLNSFKNEESTARKKKISQEKVNDAIDNTTKAVFQNYDGLGAFANLIEKTTDAASELGLGQRAEGVMEGLQRSKNRVFRGLGVLGEGTVKFAGSAMGVAAGLSGFAAAFINGQDKLIKTMIDIGLADSNVTNMTLLRQRAATLSMSFDEYAKVLQVSSNLTATSAENATQGALQFGDMAQRIRNDDSISKFGMRTDDLTFALAATADALYKSNQITSLNPQAQQKIIDTFVTTNDIALGLATTTGENRSKLLSELEAQREDVDLNTSFFAAQGEYIEKFGEEQFNNFTEGTRMYLASLAMQFGKDSVIYQEVEKTFKAAAYDIGVDQNIVNNMTPELVQLMNEIGGGVLQNFIKQGNSLLQGQTTQKQAVIDTSSLIRTVSDQGETRRREFSIDPISQAANELMSRAQVQNEQLKGITFAELQTMITDSRGAVDVADNAINIVDDIAIAFRETLEAITPGVDTLDATLDVTYWTADTAMQVLNWTKAAFGFEASGETIDNIRNSMQRAETRDIVVYKVGSSEYNSLPQGMRVTSDGDITARSIATYQAATQNMFTDQQIQEKSRQELQQRLTQLRENAADARTRIDTGIDVGNSTGAIPIALSDSEIQQLKQVERLLNEQAAKLTEQIAQMTESESAGVLN